MLINNSTDWSKRMSPFLVVGIALVVIYIVGVLVSIGNINDGFLNSDRNDTALMIEGFPERFRRLAATVTVILWPIWFLVWGAQFLWFITSDLIRETSQTFKHKLAPKRS